AFTASTCGFLWWRRKSLQRNGRTMIWLLAPQALLLATYFLGNALAFDSAVPVSGLVKQWWSAASPDAGIERWLRRLTGLLQNKDAREGIMYGALLVGLLWLRRGHRNQSTIAIAPLAVGLLVLAAAKVGYYSLTVEPPLANYGWYFVSG